MTHDSSDILFWHTPLTYYFDWYPPSTDILFWLVSSINWHHILICIKIVCHLNFKDNTWSNDVKRVMPHRMHYFEWYLSTINWHHILTFDLYFRSTDRQFRKNQINKNICIKIVCNLIFKGNAGSKNLQNNVSPDILILKIIGLFCKRAL